MNQLYLAADFRDQSTWKPLGSQRESLPLTHYSSSTRLQLAGGGGGADGHKLSLPGRIPRIAPNLICWNKIYEPNAHELAMHDIIKSIHKAKKKC